MLSHSLSSVRIGNRRKDWSGTARRRLFGQYVHDEPPTGMITWKSSWHPVGLPILVARRGHVVLGEQVVVRMVFLPLLLLPLLFLLDLLLPLWIANVSTRSDGGALMPVCPVTCAPPYLVGSEHWGRGRLLTRCCCAAWSRQRRVLQAVLALELQVGLLLDLGLVEAVDDGVLALGDEHTLDLRRRRVSRRRAARGRRGPTYFARVLKLSLAPISMLAIP